MKSLAAFFLLAVASSAVAQAPEIVAQLASGALVQGRVIGLYREGAMVQDADGHTTLVRWEELPALDAAAAAAVPAPAAAPAPSPAPSLPSHSAHGDGACCKTPLCPKPLKGKVALSGTVRTGNVDSVLGALHAEATKDYTEDKIKAEIDALYGKTGGELTAASLGGKTRWDHFFNMTFYSYASAEALYDSVQNLDLRAIVSIGAGDFLWKCNDDRSWSVEGGLSGLYEDFSTRTSSELSPAGRAATTYKDIIFKELKFEETLELLVPLNDPAGYLAHSKTILGVPLCKDLQLRFSLEIGYQGSPPPSTQKLDVLGLVGIEYQF